jgi:hypothetical protein
MASQTTSSCGASTPLRTYDCVSHDCIKAQNQVRVFRFLALAMRRLIRWFEGRRDSGATNSQLRSRALETHPDLDHGAVRQEQIDRPFGSPDPSLSVRGRSLPGVSHADAVNLLPDLSGPATRRGHRFV